MRIILLGAPGTGKGTQSQFIIKNYNIPQISTGDMLRESIYQKNKIGNIIKKIIEEGKLVPDDIVCNLIKKRIQKKDCMYGFLLDGFPRTMKQALFLSENNLKIDYVLEFIMPYESILERISGRRIHMKSGRIYHIKFNPPKIENKDDITGESLITRKDDMKESVQKRLEEYNIIRHSLIKYYIKKEKLGELKFFQINAMSSFLLIKEKIEKILKK